MTIRRGKTIAWALLLAMLPGGIAATDARAADGRLGVELNKLEPLSSACRAYLVLSNKTGMAFTDLKLDLVIFDNEGIVARRIAVQGAPVTVGKTTLKVFDIDGVNCDGIGRFLLNGVMTCAAAAGATDDCVSLIDTSSRAKAPLIK
jgi:hypothetical protein